MATQGRQPAQLEAMGAPGLAGAQPRRRRGVGGALLKGPPPPAPVRASPSSSTPARCPSPYRRDLGQTLRASRGDWIGPREALRGQQAALAAALSADPFDPKASRRSSRQTEVTEELSKRGIDLLLDQIARMTPDERQAYAAALRADRGPGPRPDHGPADRDGPNPKAP